MAVIAMRWSANCYECELKRTFADDTERDLWMKDHRSRTGHWLQKGVVNERLDIPHALTRSQALANIVNILGITRVVEDVR